MLTATLTTLQNAVYQRPSIGEIGLLHRYDDIMLLGIWMCLSPIIQNYQNGHSSGETHGFGIDHFKKGPYMSVHIYIYTCIVSLCGAWLCPCPVGTRSQSRPKGRLQLSALTHRRDQCPWINDTRMGSKELVKVGLTTRRSSIWSAPDWEHTSEKRLSWGYSDHLICLVVCAAKEHAGDLEQRKHQVDPSGDSD